MPHLTRRTALSLIGGTLLGAPFVRKARAEGTINVYNWSDYIGETTVEDFQSKTGISVTYDTYSSTEEMEAKLLAGQTGYDLVLQSGQTLPKMVKAGVYGQFDKSLLPLWGNLNPEILKITEGWDHESQHSVPYLWGSGGIGFNVDMVKERLPNADMRSLDILFKPENAEKLADCGISLLDSPTDVFFMVLKYLGKDPNAATEADYRAAAKVLKPIRKYIRTFDNTNLLNAVPNRELCVFNTWSGDYATAQARSKEAGIDVNLAYFVPDTGSLAWVDCWAMPTDASNKAGAHAFVNYLLEPEVAAQCTNFTHFANANKMALPLIDQAISSNPAIYPDSATMARLSTLREVTEEQERLMTRIWTDVKSG